MSSFEQLIANSNVNSLKTGDVLLVESKGDWIDKVIKFFARSQFTHTAMLVDIKGSWFVVEARPKHQQKEYQMMPADWWVEQNGSLDTYIGKMPSSKDRTEECEMEIENNIKNTLLNPKWSKRPYSLTWLAIAYVLQEWFGIQRPSFRHKKDESKHPMICSIIVQETWEKAGVIKKGNYKSPGDIAELAGRMNSITPINLTKTQTGFGRNFLKKSIPSQNISTLELN